MMNRKQLKLASTIVSIASIVISIGFLLFWYSKTKLVAYTDPGGFFKIGYPQKWTLVEGKDGANVIFLSPKESAVDHFQENVNIVIQDISRNPLDLAKYSEVAISQIRAVFKDAVTIVESTPTIVSTRPGYKLVYTGKGEVDEIKIMHIWVIKGNFAYQLTYSAVTTSFDRFLPKVEQMARSFKVL